MCSVLSPFQIRTHRLVSIHLEPALGPTASSVGNLLLARPQLHLNHGSGNTEVWQAHLRVDLVASDQGRVAAYHGHIVLDGVFDVHPQVPEHERLKLAAVNAGLALYASAREWIASLTARSVHGLATLPSIDAQAFVPANPPPRRTAEPEPKRASPTTLLR